MNESLRLGILIGVTFASFIWGVVFLVCLKAREQEKKPMARRRRTRGSTGHPAFFSTQQIK